MSKPEGCDACPIRTALVQNVAELEQILDLAPSMVRRMDADTTLRYVNAATADALGRPKDDLIGVKLADLLSADERAQMLANLQNVSLGDDCDVKTPDGRTQSWRDFTITDDDGAVISFISMGEDVTAARAAEETDRDALQAANRALKTALKDAETANRSRSTFLAEMSHDLRTPLNAILGFAQMIEKDVLNGDIDRYREYAANVRESGGHLLGMIDRVLDLSNADAAESIGAPEALDVKPLLDRLMRMTAPLAKPEVELKRLYDDAPLIVYGDRSMLQQALMNLLSNSAKFTTDGWIGLEAKSAGDVAQIFVKDTGAGVEPQDVERILRPFEQAELEEGGRTMTRTESGHGLGLPIARRYVELHRGKLLFRSKPGVGTVVEVRLPLHKAAAV